MQISKQGIIVQKYGGSSLSSLDKIRRVARKIVALRRTGRPVVVVVSAIGNTTSELVSQAKSIAPKPSRRELDMLLSSGEQMSMALLAMAIQEEGERSISLTGPQCGIITDATHANATIREVRPERVHSEIDAGRVVIVAGYQGESPTGEVTTLGRGGSDTTAVALAGALAADVCEIYSDVEGVYTADPRKVENARHLKRVDSLLMSEYARRGAGVLHAPCLDFARRQGVTVQAGSTFGGDLHTLISCGAALEYTGDADGEAPTIVGVSSRGRCIRVRATDDSAEARALILQTLGRHNVGRESIDEEEAEERVDLLVGAEEVPDAEGLARDIGRRLDGVADVTVDLASVSVVAADAEELELATRVDDVLRGAGAEALSRHDQPLSVTRSVAADDRLSAIRALHEVLVESSSPVAGVG